MNNHTGVDIVEIQNYGSQTMIVGVDDEGNQLEAWINWSEPDAWVDVEENPY